MEEPNRTQALKAYEILCGQWEETLDRTRENLAAGSDIADLIAAEGATLLATEGWTSEQLSFLVACLMVREAKLSPRARGARKKAVPAKRPRKKTIEVKDIPGSQALSEHADQKILEAGDDVAAA